MLIVIHNLPTSARYSEVKAIIKERCNISNIILDSLTTEGKDSRKVTVGLSDECDAAIVKKQLNGLIFLGKQLYVEVLRKNKSTLNGQGNYTINNQNYNQASTVTTVAAPTIQSNVQSTTSLPYYATNVMGGNPYSVSAQGYPPQYFQVPPQTNMMPAQYMYSAPNVALQNANLGYNAPPVYDGSQKLIADTNYIPPLMEKSQNEVKAIPQQSNPSTDQSFPKYLQKAEEQIFRSRVRPASEHGEKVASGQNEPSGINDFRSRPSFTDWNRSDDFSRQTTSDGGNMNSGGDDYIEGNQERSYDSSYEQPQDNRYNQGYTDVNNLTQPLLHDNRCDNSSDNDYHPGRGFNMDHNYGPPSVRGSGNYEYYSQFFRKGPKDKFHNSNFGSNDSRSGIRQDWNFDNFKASQLTSKKPVRNTNEKDESWRNQAVGDTARALLDRYGMIHLKSTGGFMQFFKSRIRSRIDSVMGKRVDVPLAKIKEEYDRKYPPWNQKSFLFSVRNDFFKMIGKKHEDYTKKLPQGQPQTKAADHSAIKRKAINPPPQRETDNATKKTKVEQTFITRQNTPPPGPLPNYPNADKKTNSRMKKLAKAEQTEEVYHLEPAMEAALEKEMQVIGELFVEGCKATEGDVEEEKICAKIKNICETFKKSLKVDITKRLLNVTCNIPMRLFADERVKKKELTEHLKPLGIVSMRRSIRSRRMYVVVIKDHKSFDYLMKRQTIDIRGVTLHFKPLHLTGPLVKTKKVVKKPTKKVDVNDAEEEDSDGDNDDKNDQDQFEDYEGFGPLLGNIMPEDTESPDESDVAAPSDFNTDKTESIDKNLSQDVQETAKSLDKEDGEKDVTIEAGDGSTDDVALNITTITQDDLEDY